LHNSGSSLEEHFYGSATVGERGQVVIPAEARKRMDLHHGDKVLVLGHPSGQGVCFCKINWAREMLSYMLESLDRMETDSEPEGEEK
jgi:AbrB family looped-hinge helix DNA binding protein